MKNFEHTTWNRFGFLILTNTVKVTRNSLPKADDLLFNFLNIWRDTDDENVAFFGICKLTTDSSSVYGGFYQLASMLDFKYITLFN